MSEREHTSNIVNVSGYEGESGGRRKYNTYMYNVMKKWLFNLF